MKNQFHILNSHAKWATEGTKVKIMTLEDCYALLKDNKTTYLLFEPLETLKTRLYSTVGELNA